MNCHKNCTYFYIYTYTHTNLKHVWRNYYVCSLSIYIVIDNYYVICEGPLSLFLDATALAPEDINMVIMNIHTSNASGMYTHMHKWKKFTSFFNTLQQSWENTYIEYMYIHKYTYICIHVCMYIYIKCMYTYWYKYRHI